MITKRRFYLFALQLPITLIVGILLYFAYSMRFHEDPHIDWLIALSLGVLLDVVITMLNKRDEKRHQHIA